MINGRWQAEFGRWLTAGPRWRAWAVGAAGVVSLGGLAWAAAAGGGAAAAPADDPLAGGGLVLDVMLKLGLVIALIYASLFALRRWPGGTAGLFTSAARQVTVLETTRLSPRQALHLVRAGGQVFLVGATDQSLTLLAELDHAEAPAASAPRSQPAFSAALGRALTGAEGAPRSGEAA
ncbi:MAG: flagellar biosynthetic protein FliO [Anaerolineales bacterium]|nr:flagellar biosynthetic protein FliO [Anaerolineales bacterium]